MNFNTFQDEVLIEFLISTNVDDNNKRCCVPFSWSICFLGRKFDQVYFFTIESQPPAPVVAYSLKTHVFICHAFI